MFSGPMFRREFQAATRNRRLFVFRTVFAVFLGIAALLIGLFLLTRSPEAIAPKTPNILLFGRAMFLATIGIELVFLLAFVPSFVAGCIAEEHEKDTLAMLLLTRLRPIEIVAIKVVARWLASIDPVLIGLPILLACAWLAGLQTEIIPALVVLFSSSAFMASLAIFASAQRNQVGTARALAMGSVFAWLIVPPLMTILPIKADSLWGAMLAELKWLCTFVAPSSPMSLLTDNAWFYRPQVVSLEGRVAWMVGLQALFGLVALYLAAGRLLAREKNPNWIDPTRGHRPRCGDDPIYWREYELPIRRGSGSLLVIRLRYVVILIKAALINILTLVGVLLLLAIPIGLLVATLYYGSAAFQELWAHGYGGAGPFEARGNFNLLIRAATAALALLPALGTASLVAARITTERDKKTWDLFLTTPLTSEEILRSKARVALDNLWQVAKPLPILWGLGIACGVVYPLGVALAAIDLLLTVWASVALGLSLGVRPGATNVTLNRTSRFMLVSMVLHVPLLAALLVSPVEYAVFVTWRPSLQWGLVVGGLVVSTLTGMLAWIETRRTIARFDEWVGRPIAGGAPRAVKT